MSNYNFRMDLSKLDGFGTMNLTNEKGEVIECSVIPNKKNNIFVGNKGVYLDLTCIESNNSQYGDTHFVIRAKSEDERQQEKLSGERIKTPIVGNLKPFGNEQGGTYNGGQTYTMGHPLQQPMQQPAQRPAQQTVPSQTGFSQQMPSATNFPPMNTEDDGLPF